MACGGGREPSKKGSKPSRFSQVQRSEIVTGCPQTQRVEGFPSPAPKAEPARASVIFFDYH